MSQKSQHGNFYVIMLWLHFLIILSRFSFLQQKWDFPFLCVLYTPQFSSVKKDQVPFIAKSLYFYCGNYAKILVIHFNLRKNNNSNFSLCFWYLAFYTKSCFMECVKNTFSITKCHLINKRFVTSQKAL